MQDFEFHEKADLLFQFIEDAIDMSETDETIDCEIQSGILNISFSDSSKIIINKQEPLHQVWMATKFNGHHFAFDTTTSQWTCVRTGALFFDVLTDAMTRQSGAAFQFAPWHG